MTHPEEVDKYTRKKLLGSGTFGRVYLVTDKENKSEYAMKIVEMSKNIFDSYTRQVITFQRITKAPYSMIVTYENSFLTDFEKQFVIIMEYCAGNNR